MEAPLLSPRHLRFRSEVNRDWQHESSESTHLPRLLDADAPQRKRRRLECRAEPEGSRLRDEKTEPEAEGSSQGGRFSEMDKRPAIVSGVAEGDETISSRNFDERVKRIVKQVIAPYQSRVDTLAKEVIRLRKRVDHISIRALLDDARNKVLRLLQLRIWNNVKVLRRKDTLHTAGLSDADISLLLSGTRNADNPLRRRANEAAHQVQWTEIAAVINRTDDDVRAHLAQLFKFAYLGCAWYRTNPVRLDKAPGEVWSAVRGRWVMWANLDQRRHYSYSDS